MELDKIAARIEAIRKAPELDPPPLAGFDIQLDHPLRIDVLSECDELFPQLSTGEGRLTKTLSHHAQSYLDGLLGAMEELIRQMGQIRLDVAPSDSKYMLRIGEIRAKASSTIQEVRTRQLGIHSALLAASQLATLDGPVLERASRLDDLLNRTGKTQSDVESLHDVLRNAIGAKQAASSRLAFSLRARAHEKYECWSMIAFSASILLAILAIYRVYHSTIAVDASSPQIVVFVTHNVVLLGAITILARLTLRRWNLERNLQIIYRHRVAAIQQYEFFSASISDDQQDAKDRLRLEIARILFTDPATGYLEDSTSEVSITPVVNNMLDRFQKGNSQ